MPTARPVVQAAPDDDQWAGLWFRQDPSPRLVVDRRLAVRAINLAAERLVNGPCLLRVRDGLLSSVDRAVAASLREVVVAAKPGAPSTGVLELAAHDSLVIEATALPDSGCVAIRLRDLHGEAILRLADLTTAFGLTSAEQQVLDLLMRGLTVTEAAERSSRSIFTVRTHVKRAYQKLGISSREQMFAKLLKFAFLR